MTLTSDESRGFFFAFVRDKWDFRNTSKPIDYRS